MLAMMMTPDVLAQIPGQLWHVFYFIVAPMLLLAGVGYVIQKTVGLDMPTLTKLNFYFVIPGMIYASLVTSQLSGQDVGVVVLFAVALMAASAAVTAAAWLTRTPGDTRSVLAMTTIFHNSGNYGLPLQDLAFRQAALGAEAMLLQVFIMVTQNIATFTLGVVMAARGKRAVPLRQCLTHIAKFPPIYVLAAAVVTIQVRRLLGERAPAVGEMLVPLWTVIGYVKGAFIAVALCTLGAQLAQVRPGKSNSPVTLSVVIRLVGGPLLAVGIIHLMGLSGFIAKVLLIGSATPTAVNAMLLCLQFDNHPEYAARAVFYSTLLSPLTVTLVVFGAQSGLYESAATGPQVPAQTVSATESRIMDHQTTVSIRGEDFLINGRPTYEGRTFRGLRVEGLLMNSRMVQGIFDDLNPETRGLWAYPDGPYDAERNTREFVAAMPLWRQHGLLAFTINLQGGSPQGYSKVQPWHNSAFTAEGDLRGEYMARLKRICDRADELGMVVILGYFYFGQDERLRDEAAVLRAADNATDWILAQGYRHVLVEIANEVNVPRYEHPILTDKRAHELIERVQKRSRGKIETPAGRLLVSTSMGGGGIPPRAILAQGDFVLLHGNGVGDPDRIRQMVVRVRQSEGYHGGPILFNEDDHFDFDKPDNNMLAAVSQHAGWGFFDFRLKGETHFDEGYQSVPANWTLSSSRKKGFFGLLAEMTDAAGARQE